MRMLKKLMGVLLVLTLCMTVLPLSVYAEDFSCKLSITDSDKLSKVTENVEGDKLGIPGLSFSGGGEGKGGTLTWDGGAEFSQLTEKEQKKAVSKYYEITNEASLSASASNKMSDLLSNTAEGVDVDISLYLMVDVFDQTKGDMTGGMKLISPFLPYINILLGLIAILLVSLLVLSTLIDLACIGLPAVRDWMLSAGDKDGNNQGAKKPKAITYAAWSTISDVEGDGQNSKGSGKNAYFTYFKKRIVDYVVLGICLSFLVFGGFSGIMKAFLDIGSQFVGG